MYTVELLVLLFIRSSYFAAPRRALSPRRAGAQRAAGAAAVDTCTPTTPARVAEPARAPIASATRRRGASDRCY